ncbi:MAG: DUF192 domain-containing protein [Anaerolineae bacterium]|nr:DUF192 domain-containing protein [Caldilineales bacterium]MDW8268860.1 DUF192 domain-containing protein [Anaerolineae bacterium]
MAFFSTYPVVSIRNETTDTVLATRARLAQDFWSRLKGLIGAKDLADGEGLVIMPCHSIHTMFMAFPIDVLYVDAEHRVVDIDIGLQPWKLSLPRRRSRYVIELPAGTVVNTGTAVGDRLSLEQHNGLEP